MTLTPQGFWKLAPDAAPGSPHTNNIIPIMAHCRADEPLTVEETTELCKSLVGKDPSELRQLILTLRASINLLHATVRHLQQERDYLCGRLDEATRAGFSSGDF